MAILGVSRVLACIVGSAVAALAQAAAVEKAGVHFVLKFHHGKLPAPLAERLAGEALTAAEGIWPTVERLLLLRAGPPATIHLHAVEADYRAIEKQITSAVGDRLDMVVRLAEQEAHIAFLPALLAPDLEVVGLPVSVANHVVLAAAQLLAAQKSKAAVTDPWLAGVFAYGVLEGKQAQAPRYGIDPVFDSRRWYHASAEDPPSLRRWVTEVMLAPARPGLEYAEEGKVLVAQLVAGSGGDWARRLLQNPAKPTDPAVVVREAAIERLLGSDWAKIDARWRKQLAAVRVPFYVRSPLVAVRGKRLLLVGSPDVAATLNAEEELPTGPYRIRATFETTGSESDGVRLQLDWDGTSLLGLFFRPGDVRLEEWQADKPWASVASAKVPIVNGKPFDVVVEVGNETKMLVVSVDGLQALRWNHGARGMRGSWSIAKNQTPVFVEGLRVEAIGEK